MPVKRSRHLVAEASGKHRCVPREDGNQIIEVECWPVEGSRLTADGLNHRNGRVLKQLGKKYVRCLNDNSEGSRNRDGKMTHVVRDDDLGATDTRGG